MKRLELGARDRRTATAGAVAIVVMMGAGRGLPALRAWDTRARVHAAAIADDLSAARSARRDLATIRDSLRARRARYAMLDTTVIVAQSSADGAAALASTLEDLADDASFRVTGLQVRADTATVAELAHVGVRLSGVADVRGVSELLRAIEGDEKTLMVVRELSIVQQDPTAPASKAEALRVDLLVVALCIVRRGGAA